MKGVQAQPLSAQVPLVPTGMHAGWCSCRCVPSTTGASYSRLLLVPVCTAWSSTRTETGVQLYGLPPVATGPAGASWPRICSPPCSDFGVAPTPLHLHLLNLRCLGDRVFESDRRARVHPSFQIFPPSVEPELTPPHQERPARGGTAVIDDHGHSRSSQAASHSSRTCIQ